MQTRGPPRELPVLGAIEQLEPRRVGVHRRVEEPGGEFGAEDVGGCCPVCVSDEVDLRNSHAYYLEVFQTDRNGVI